MTHENSLVGHLLQLSDSNYRAFHAKLIPTVDAERIIGIRTPILRRYAKELGKDNSEAQKSLVDSFMEHLPHYYYEENNLHAYLIGIRCREITAALDEVNRLLPYVDNWATCDTMAPKIFGKHPEVVKREVDRWLRSQEVYTIRFGIVVLLQYFLEGNFEAAMLHQVNRVSHTDYYVRMAQAWYFSFALIKQYESTIGLFTTPCIEKWVHNKAIQKAIESYRILPEQKIFLRSLRR